MSKRASSERDRDALFRSMGLLAKETWSDDISPSADSTERARFEAALGIGKRRRSGSRALVRLAAAAVLACAIALGIGFVWSSPLAYVVARSSSNVGGYLQPGNVGPATAAFSDGTVVRVAPGGRARVVDTDRHGARIALEQGRATLSVVHKAGARWSVEAGPFTIAVTGTEFDAEWSGVDERLVVELRKGSVVVSGPLAVNGIGLAAGQRLIANVRDGQIHIEPLLLKEPTTSVAANGGAPVEPFVAPGSGTAGTAPGPSLDETGTEPEAPRPTPDATARVLPENPIEPVPSATAIAPEPAPAANWEKRVRAGDFAGVVHDAEARGVDGTLQSGSRSDLSALADAARYTGNTEVADRALAAVEKRFAGSADAKAAAFLRGRIAEARGSRAEAITLYDRYLAEAPRGAFAAEALGRKMLAVRALSGESAARALAQDYLVRFPKGPYAAPARKLVGSE